METSTSEISKIDQLLPQTQCTQCGFPRCYDYARALLNGDADINQCPPGGVVTIKKLADYFSRTPLALNPGNGEHKPRQLAFITEAECIGCTLCIQACPVDAILGAGKLMHSVIAEE
ncbi:MAG: RnfABCDGE type electron transport complex subunit B, partial [Arenicellales bacterium WSBS_2016_MAG_OTU3]